MYDRTPEEVNTLKQFAEPYNEGYEEVDPDELSQWQLRHGTFDITYITHSGTKTVRSRWATTPADYNNLSEGCISFRHDGSKYIYEIEDQRLISANTDGRDNTVARSDDILRVQEVQYPERAPVEGGVEEGVEATIYYRSPRSNHMQTVTVSVRSMEGNAVEIRGEDVESGDNITAHTRYDRDLTKSHKSVTLGKVARVEFPKGHQFTVEVEGLKDSKAGRDAEDKIRRAVKSKLRNDDLSVSVNHDGELEWGDI